MKTIEKCEIDHHWVLTHLAEVSAKGATNKIQEYGNILWGKELNKTTQEVVNECKEILIGIFEKNNW